MSRCLCTVVAFVALLLASLAPPAGAAPAGARYQRQVDPRVALWLRVPALRAKDREGRAAHIGRAPIVLRFRRVPSAGELARLQRGDVRFVRAASGEGWRHLRLFYPATASARALRVLELEANVARVELDTLPPYAPRPLELTASETQARATWLAQSKAGVSLTGQGVLIGSLDSGVDVYHPAFFRADGGLYAWIDVDGNGRFDPGKDAVDLNGNGKADAGETLGLIDARVTDLRQTSAILDSVNGRYDAARDWLYADTNANGKRDLGAGGGFSDKSPGFGEPLFVAEDLDGDGALGLHEKLRALSTCKIAYTYAGGVSRVRGVDLSATPNDADGLHGTGTTGIMIAGQRGHLARVGLAPDADVALAVAGAASATDPSGGLSDALIWLVKERKVNVVLHEYAPWTGYHLDGSSSHEQLMDQASGLGIPQVVPAGNLALAGDKHALLEVAAGGSVEVPVIVPPPDPYYGTHTFLQLTLLWRTPTASPVFELVDANGTVKTLAPDNTQGDWWDVGKIAYYSWREDSSRGTAKLDVYLVGDDGKTSQPLPPGTWTLRVQNASGPALSIWAYVGDAISSWGPGVGFGAFTRAEGTVCWPATADSAITVAAYAGHIGPPYEDEVVEQSGALRAYSSRGKRIDGTSILDIAAPDNPLTPVNRFSSNGDQVQHGLGEYIVFGGTSGAGPHVAAAVALMLQHDPQQSAADVKARLRSGALADAQVGAVPSDSWGAGKLRIHRAIFDSDPVANQPPTIQIDAPSAVYVGQTVTFRAVVADAEDGADKLVVRWDEGYDDSWESSDASTYAKTFTQEGTYWLKAEARDSRGQTAAAAVLLHVQAASARPDGGVGDGGAGGGGGGGGGCRVGGDRSSAGAAASLLCWLGLALLARLRRRLD